MSDSWDEDLDGDEPWDDNDPVDLIRCSGCGAEIYEESVRCPLCGEYVTAVHNVWENRSAWWVILGVLGILAVVLTLIQAV